MTTQLSMTQEKQKVALVSMFASGLLAIVKFVAAVLTGSLGLLSEAIHSLIDFGATILTLFAIRWADQPADEDHHYGHAKVESVAALIETALLFLTTIWIVYEAVHRLIAGSSPVAVPWWAIAILIASIVIDYNRAKSLQRVADASSSQALAADALHFRSDMWSSGIVLVGLGLVWLGFPKADAIAAIVVAGFIAIAGYKLGKQTLATLIDTAPEGATPLIKNLAETTPGVLAVKLLRVRPAGPTLFVSLVVEVARTMAVDEMVRLRNDLSTRIKNQFPAADIVITTDPVTLDNETIFDKVTMIANRSGCNIHHLTVQHINGRMAVSFDIEFDGETPLTIAHEKATELEVAIRQELGDDVEVESHIEPQPLRYLEGKSASETVEKSIITHLKKLAAHHKTISDLHNFRVRQADGGLFVHYHCRFAGAASVNHVHAVVDQIENELVTKFPKIYRVIAHAEPIGRAHHKL
jgi:cation diffusion facilitator family transporter